MSTWPRRAISPPTTRAAARQSSGACRLDPQKTAIRISPLARAPPRPAPSPAAAVGALRDRPIGGRRRLGGGARRRREAHLGHRPVLGEVGRADRGEVAASLLVPGEQLHHRQEAVDADAALALGQRAQLLLDLHLEPLAQPLGDLPLGRELALSDLDLVDLL